MFLGPQSFPEEVSCLQNTTFFIMYLIFNIIQAIHREKSIALFNLIIIIYLL